VIRSRHEKAKKAITKTEMVKTGKKTTSIRYP